MAHPPVHIQLYLPCSSSFGTKILEGASRFAREKPHVRLIINNQLNIQTDGILAALDTPANIPKLQKIKLPVVNVTDIQLHPTFPTVMCNNYAIGKTAAEYLVLRGFYQMATYGWDKPNPDADPNFASERFRGFIQTLEKHNRPYVQILPEACSEQWKTHLQQLCDQLQSLPRPLAIWCSCDQMGANLLYACRELGLGIPDDIGVLGIGDEFPICEICEPAISSVDTAIVQRGYRGMAMLTHWIENQTRAPRTQVLQPVGVTERGSTNALHFTDIHLRTVMQLIMENLDGDLHIERLLDHVPISRRRLETKCRNILGESLAQIIRKARLNRARELLIDTSQSIHDIAGQCGYKNISAFSAAFTRDFGSKPSVYRKMLGQP